MRQHRSSTMPLADTDEPGTIDAAHLNRAALKVLPALTKRWLPDGRLIGRKWVAKNPRSKKKPSSRLKIELATGRWDDFDTGDWGRGAISLAVFLFGLSPDAAARKLYQLLGLG